MADFVLPYITIIIIICRIRSVYAKTTGCTYSLPENWNLYGTYGNNDMDGARAGK